MHQPMTPFVTENPKIQKELDKVGNEILKFQDRPMKKSETIFKVIMSKYNPKEEKTFVLIKPDGVRKGLIGEVIKRFEQRDLKIVALEMFMPTVKQIDNHYPKSKAWITRLGEKTLATYKQFDFNASIFRREKFLQIRMPK